MTRRMGVAQLKAQLSEILREVEQEGLRVVVERRGRAVALLSPHDPSVVAEEPAHWARALDGVARDLADFDDVMKDVIAARRDAGSREVDLED